MVFIKEELKIKKHQKFTISSIDVSKSIWGFCLTIWFTGEPMTRFELVTSSLPRKRSTPELHRQKKSERPGSNRRHSAWKADALPTELLPHFLCGESRIRTCEGKNQQIYSLSSLAAWVSPQIKYFKELSRWRDSNPRPADYKSAALASWATSACFKKLNAK